MDSLQLPPCHQDSKDLLVCVDHFSRYVVLAPVKEKTANTIAHNLIANLICPYSTQRVLLIDNGKEFCNALLEEFASNFT